MSEPAAAARSDDAQLGREAAQLVAESWPDANGLIERATEEFAAAAVERLAELIGEQPALFQASRRGSEQGAESLSARRFQGIVESIQNGDDLEASELRLALRLNGPRRELLIVHNGAPISLVHVAAMVLPWVTTKADDPGASGRFGIGQKTLRALGGPIDAHCDPYHFRMDEVPAPCPPEPAIDGFYDPAARETLLVVPLYDEVDVVALEQFIADRGTRALVFLRSIRRVALLDLTTGAARVDHQLHERQRRSAELDVHGHKLEVEIVELTDRAQRGILLADGTRVVPPRPDEPRSLVIRDEPQSLASQLGLTLAIHPVYLGSDKPARRIRRALEEEELLVRSYESDSAALALLARGKSDPIRLDDAALLSLRDAFERLSDDDQRERGRSAAQSSCAASAMTAAARPKHCRFLRARRICRHRSTARPAASRVRPPGRRRSPCSCPDRGALPAQMQLEIHRPMPAGHGPRGSPERPPTSPTRARAHDPDRDRRPKVNSRKHSGCKIP